LHSAIYVLQSRSETSATYTVLSVFRKRQTKKPSIPFKGKIRRARRTRSSKVLPFHSHNPGSACSKGNSIASTSSAPGN
jgi:hypothetical protein